MKIRTKNGIHFAKTERIDRKKRETEIFSEQIVPLQKSFFGSLCSMRSSWLNQSFSSPREPLLLPAFDFSSLRQESPAEAGEIYFLMVKIA